MIIKTLKTRENLFGFRVYFIPDDMGVDGVPHGLQTRTHGQPKRRSENLPLGCYVRLLCSSHMTLRRTMHCPVHNPFTLHASRDASLVSRTMGAKVMAEIGHLFLKRSNDFNRCLRHTVKPVICLVRPIPGVFVPEQDASIRPRRAEGIESMKGDGIDAIDIHTVVCLLVSMTFE